jgi:hypothetical protein
MDWIVFGIAAFIVCAGYIIAIIIGERHNCKTSKSYCFDRDEPELF